jgi:hypothetical protein
MKKYYGEIPEEYSAIYSLSYITKTRMLEFRDDFYATAFSGYIFIDECKRKKEERLLVLKDGEDS